MFKVNSLSQKPVYEQLIEQTEKYILTGIIAVGEAMPSVRKLSHEASVNPNTVGKAYSELIGMGILVSVPGKGCFVAENAVEIIGNSRRAKLCEVKEIFKELKLAGIKQEEIISVVAEVYSENI